MQIAVGLSFPGTLKDESVICSLCKDFDIDVIIIEASFSMSRGWAILKMIGEEEELQRAFVYIRNKNIKLEKIKSEKEI